MLVLPSLVLPLALLAGSLLADCPPPANQSELNSFLWTIRRDPAPPSYLFGSIHVPFTKVWSYIPENTRAAFRRADRVLFELDLTDEDTLKSLTNCQLLPDGQTLSNVLPQDLYRRLKRHLSYVRSHLPEWMSTDQRASGMAAEMLYNRIVGNWEHKRPVWVMLMVNSLTETSIQTNGIPVLDLFLAQQATRMAKRTGAVEKVEEHCIPLNELNFSQALFTLNQTLWQQEQYYRTPPPLPPQPSGSAGFTTAELISHYNCGDLDTIIYSADSPVQMPSIVQVDDLPPQQTLIAERINQYFLDELIYKRNQRMANRVAKLLRAHPSQSFFFAFGAGHFLGNNTVIEKLRSKGVDVQYTSAGSDLYRGQGYEDSADGDDLFGELPAAVMLDHNPFTNPRRHRHRHRNQRNGRKKGRRKEQQSGGGEPVPTDSDRLKRPQFKDLWVRLEATSFGPNSLFRRLQQSAPPTTASPPVPKYAMYNNHGNVLSPSNQILLLLLLCLVLR